MGRIRRGLVSGVWVLLVFVAVFGVVLNVPVVRGSGTIYIRADGSIDPPTAPIFSSDNVTYTFTDNISSDASGIIVERSNIIIDGNGYTLQGTESVALGYRGIHLSEASNVTIKKTNIKTFGVGISLYDSHYNTISGNNITNNNFGVEFEMDGYSSYNVISQNNIANNAYHGIWIRDGSQNTFTENNVTNNGYGIIIDDWGSCYDNKIYHNNLLWNTHQVYIFDPRNIWDDGYPSGGNYWSDHIGADEKNGPNQDQPGSDRIADTPYFLDRYPLMSPWPPPLHDLTLNLKAPTRLPPGAPASIKATVSNIGFSKEENITIFWFINETIVNLTTISLLEVLSSSTISYVWIPVIEGQYNVTAYVTPVLGETHIANNRRTTFVTVGKSPVKNINTDLYYVAIQEAIDAPETLDGHTIQAEAETYYEHLTINKSLKIIGEDRTNTTIDGSKTGTFVVHITANNVALSGFTIQNSNAAPTPAIRIDSSNNVISNNIIIKNGWGVYIFGGSNNTIENNIINNNSYGAVIESIGKVAVQKNEISDNSESGLKIIGKSNLIIKENTIKRNKYGIIAQGSSTYQSVISGVTIINNEVSYNLEDGIYMSSYGVGGYYGPPGYGYINDVIISFNNVSYNQGDGIQLYSYGYGSASISGYGFGYIYNVSVSSNYISSNGGKGIYLYSYGYGSGSGYSVYSGEGWGYSYIFNVSVASNIISSNLEHGIYLYSYGYGYGAGWGHGSYGYGWGFGYIYDVLFSSNNISSNGGSGAYLYSYGEGYGYGWYSGSGWGRGRIYNVTVHLNNILHNSGDGIFIYSYGKGMGNGEGLAYVFNVAVSKNRVSLNNGSGLQVRASHHNTTLAYDISISKNLISANSQKGVWIEGGINANVTRNSISSNIYGVFYNKTTNNFASHNNVYENFYGMNVTDGATVNAENNYWGNETGPYNPSLNPTGEGNPINGDGTDLDFIPFLSAPVLFSPISDFSYLPQFPFVSETITFNPSASWDIDGSIVEYEWDFGDGNVTIVVDGIIAHVYMAQGSYTVNLTVTDNDGLTDSTVKSITIKGLSSTITVYVDPATVPVGSNVTINGTITPTRVGVNVTISYRPLGATWTTLATVKTDPDSHYTYAWKTTDKGIYEIKASWHGDQYTSAAESETKTVSVVPYIYIRPDGSVDPVTAPIQRFGNTYTFTSNVFYSVAVQRDNIVLDGNSYSITGEETGVGLELFDISNVTVKNVVVQNFEKGVYLKDSTNCIIINNNITNNQFGVTVESMGEVVIEENEIYGNFESGIMIVGQSNVLIKENIIEQNRNGIATDASDIHSGIIIVNNTILANRENGIYLNSYGFSYIYSITVSFNRVSSNIGNGIKLYNLVYGYGAHGYIYNITLSSNIVLSNGEDGIQLYNYSPYIGAYGNSIYDVLVSSNTVSSNIGNGIKLYNHWSEWSEIRNVALLSNTVTSNDNDGIQLYSVGGYGEYHRNGYVYNITISSNTVSSNAGNGIYLHSRGHIYNVIVSSNTVSSNILDGIYLYSFGYIYGSFPSTSGYIYNVTVWSNVVSLNNEIGISFYANTNVYNVKMYHNNFINNTSQAHISESYHNVWDDGYPSGGNYWSDYTGVDLKSGPNQDLPGSDGIGDTPYVINANNRDRYPLMYQWPDITSPTTIDDYDGSWYTMDFTINLTATDDLSAVAETYYKINDGPIQNVSTHGQPLITTESANNTLEYWSVDNAGNEETHHILTGIKLDKTAPAIGTPSREPAGDVQPDQPVKVSVNVTDQVSQVKNVTLHYSLNNGTSWEQPIPMNYSFSTNLYEATIPGQKAGTWVRYKIVTYDYAGNNITLDGMEPYCIYQVVPEFPSWTILPLFIVATLMAVLIHRRKRSTHPQTLNE